LIQKERRLLEKIPEEYIGYKDKIHQDYGFCLYLKNIIIHISMIGREYKIVSIGTFFIIYIILYAIKDKKPIVI
jgi:hypothetical protein